MSFWTAPASQALSAPPVEAGLDGPLDGFVDDLQSFSDAQFDRAFALDDAALRADDAATVALGVAGKAYHLVEEGARDTLFGAAQALLHPLDALGGLGAFAAAPQRAIGDWWQTTDVPHAFQDTLSVALGLGALGARPAAPRAALSGADLFEAADTALPAAAGDGAWNALADFLGSGLHVPDLPARTPRLDRDFSPHMMVRPDGHLSYLAPRALGVDDQFLHADLGAGTGELRYTIQRSRDPANAQRLGYGSEMFGSMVRAYERNGFEIGSIVDRWSRWDGLDTNLNQFLGGIDAGLEPRVAAARTFSGEQAGSFGFTAVEVPGEPHLWRSLGVQPRFGRPDWGFDAQWANYANTYARAMGGR